MSHFFPFFLFLSLRVVLNVNGKEGRKEFCFGFFAVLTLESVKATFFRILSQIDLAKEEGERRRVSFRRGATGLGRNHCEEESDDD